MPPAVMAAAEALGLKPVGWIFTDLTADGTNGSVKHYRGDMVLFHSIFLKTKADLNFLFSNFGSIFYRIPSS